MEFGDESPKQRVKRNIQALTSTQKKTNSLMPTGATAHIGLLRLVDEEQRQSGNPAMATLSVRAEETQWAKNLLVRRSQPFQLCTNLRLLEKQPLGVGAIFSPTTPCLPPPPPSASLPPTPRWTMRDRTRTGWSGPLRPQLR